MIQHTKTEVRIGPGFNFSILVADMLKFVKFTKGSDISKTWTGWIRLPNSTHLSKARGEKETFSANENEMVSKIR